jgi:hypothetical protein
MFNVIVDRLDVTHENAQWMIDKNTSLYTFSPYSYSPSKTKWVETTFKPHREFPPIKALSNDMIPYGVTSTIAAIYLGIYMGCKQIGVIGFDLKGHPVMEGLSESVNQISQDAWNFCIKQGVELVNLSNESMVNSIPYMEMNKFIDLYGGA